MILLLRELRPCRRRRNSEAQSRLSEVVSDDSRQHVLDYVPLFSWCDSNATWQCQQQCFLQQKEWWLAIHLWLGIFTWHGAVCNKPGQVIFVWRKEKKKEKKKPSVKLQVHKNALYVWGGNWMTVRLKSASHMFWWNGAFTYQIARQTQHVAAEWNNKSQMSLTWYILKRHLPKKKKKKNRHKADETKRLVQRMATICAVYYDYNQDVTLGQSLSSWLVEPVRGSPRQIKSLKQRQHAVNVSCVSEF